MPSRLIDYESLWTSTKLARLPREEDREAYLWIFGMADGHEGVFEADPRLIWQKTCAYMRPSHTPATIGRLLDELEKVKLLFRWRWKRKVLGFWIGITKPGRLPPPSKMKRSPAKYPGPPQDLLEAFLSQGTAPEDGPLFSQGKVAIEGFAAGTALPSTKPPEGCRVGTARVPNGYRVGTRGDLGVIFGRGEEKGVGVGLGGERAETRPEKEKTMVSRAPSSSSPLVALLLGAPRPPARGNSADQKKNDPENSGEGPESSREIIERLRKKIFGPAASGGEKANGEPGNSEPGGDS